MEKTKTNQSGTVYLVGAGPGDAGLLTLRARELLEKAEVVFYDHLVNPEILNFCPQAKTFYVGKVGHGDYVPQEKIELQLVGAARKNAVVVRLKGGDPFIFGRGGEEAEFLHRSGIPFEVVPGVTSAIAVPAYAGIPLTHRDLASSVTFVTGHEEAMKGESSEGTPSLDWKTLAGAKTLVFLMTVKTLAQNFQKLREQGMSAHTPAAIIEWGTYGNQRTLTGDLETLAVSAEEHHIQPPAVVVVGEVVRLREKLSWFEKRPLFGKKILITRGGGRENCLRRDLENLGASIQEFPTLRLLPVGDKGPLDRALGGLKTYAWILFTSVNGVDYFFRRMRELGLDIRELGLVKVAAVGPATKRRLEYLGLKVERQPAGFTTDELGRSLRKEEIFGKRILFPRAEVAREELVKDLQARGAQVEVVPVYRTEIPEYPEETLTKLFQSPLPDMLTFASSSAVRNLHLLLKDTPYLREALRVPSVVIGPVTRETAVKLGFKVVGMPETYTLRALGKTVVDYFLKNAGEFHSLP